MVTNTATIYNLRGARWPEIPPQWVTPLLASALIMTTKIYFLPKQNLFFQFSTSSSTSLLPDNNLKGGAESDSWWGDQATERSWQSWAATPIWFQVKWIMDDFLHLNHKCILGIGWRAFRQIPPKDISSSAPYDFKHFCQSWYFHFNAVNTNNFAMFWTNKAPTPSFIWQLTK